MTAFPASPATLSGAPWAVAGMFVFSVNDMLMKALSGDYALHQVIFLRSVFGVLFLLAVAVPLAGGLSVLRTRRLGQHVLRGLCVFFANMFFFLGLAAIPLAEAVAISFVSPLLIAALSVPFLGERVGPRRWAAIGAGLAGVVVVLRPGTEAFQVAALLPLVGAVFYAGMHIFTRRIGGTENATALAIYIQLTFLVTSALVGLGIGHGQFAGSGDPSLDFLLRPWVWPDAGMLALMALIGMLSALGGYAVGQAYRLSEAAYVAPFEYAAMPLAVFWGLLMFGELPDAVAWVGILMIVAAGLVLIWREAAARRQPG